MTSLLTLSLFVLFLAVVMCMLLYAAIHYLPKPHAKKRARGPALRSRKPRGDNSWWSC